VKRIIPLLVIVMMVSACKIRFDVGATVNADESGTLSIVVAMDEELRQLSEGDADLTLGEEDVPAGWVVEEYVDGVFEGVRVSTTFSSLEELREQVAEIAEGTADSDEALPEFISQIELTREGDVFTFMADLSGLEDGLGSAVGGGGDSFGIDPSAFLADLFEIRIVITLPGEIVSHNADVVAENTLTWNLSILDDGRVLEAESDAGTGSPGMVIALIVLVIVIAAVGYMVMMKRKEGESTAAASEDASTDNAEG
jgi:hypothetical protein